MRCNRVAKRRIGVVSLCVVFAKIVQKGTVDPNCTATKIIFHRDLSILQSEEFLLLFYLPTQLFLCRHISEVFCSI